MREADCSVGEPAEWQRRSHGDAEHISEDSLFSAVDDLLMEREIRLTEIANTKERPIRSEGMCRRVFQTFTRREVFALAAPKKSLPCTVPALDENRRVTVAWKLSTITKARCRKFSNYAWGSAALSVENGLHPERAWSRSRGAGISM